MAIILFLEDLAAIALDATALIHCCPRLDGMCTKGVWWDHSSCLMEAGGRFLFTTPCCPWWMSFEPDKQGRAAARAVYKSHELFGLSFKGSADGFT